MKGKNHKRVDDCFRCPPRTKIISISDSHDLRKVNYPRWGNSIIYLDEPTRWDYSQVVLIVHLRTDFTRSMYDEWTWTLLSVWSFRETHDEPSIPKYMSDNDGSRKWTRETTLIHKKNINGMPFVMRGSHTLVIESWTNGWITRHGLEIPNVHWETLKKGIWGT